MKPHYLSRHLLPALCMLLVGSSALAHGAMHQKSAPVKKEQTEWGIAGDARPKLRTITITMSDQMRFSPEQIAVKQGETVKFVIKNQGAMLHEFVLGTKPKLEEHAALMLKFPNMEHDEPYMAHVAPSGQASLIWQFNRSGEFDFACLIAGHYQAGMVGKIKVNPTRSKT